MEKNLKEISQNIRKEIVKLIYEARSGHPGGSLSIADILTVLYFDEMNINKNNFKSPDRDRFVL